MTIPSSGPISLQTLQTEFGGTNPISLNEYYAGGGLVPSGTSGTFGAVPSSGPIGLQNFYGTSNLRYFSNAFSESVTFNSGSSTSFTGSSDIVTSDGNPLGNIWSTGEYRVSTGTSTRSFQYISKMSAANGSLISQSYISSGTTALEGRATLELDSSNNIYFGFGGSFTSAAMGLVKYTSSLSALWSYVIPQIYLDYDAFSVSSSSGSMYMGGSDYATFTKGTIIKLTSAPAMAWVRTIVTGSSPQYSVNSLALDSSENVYAVGGGFNSSTGGSVTSFIIKYNSSGTLQWQRRLTLASPFEISLACTAVSPTGDVYVAGHSYNQTTTNGKIFLARYNSSGVIQWQRELTDSNVSPIIQLVPRDIAIDPFGNIYVVGKRFVAQKTEDESTYIIKFDSSGAIIWQREIIISTTMFASSGAGGRISFNSAGDIYLAINYSVTTVSGGGNNVLGWTIKLPSDGSKTGNQVITATSVRGQTIFLDYLAISFTIAAGSVTDAAGAYTFASPATSSLTALSITTAPVPYGPEETIVNSLNTIA